MPRDLNYFDVVGVKNDFDLSTQEVQKKYRQLHARLHPDKFGQKSEKEKEISENLSASVDKAHSTLMYPFDRDIYKLKLHNVFIPEYTTSLEPQFLIEIMEINEQLEEASNDKDKALNLLKENREIITSSTKQFSNAFHNEIIEEAKRLLIRIKYYISIENRLNKLKQSLHIVQ